MGTLAFLRLRTRRFPRTSRRTADSMPSAFTHAFAAAALGTVIIPEQRRLIALGALCAVLPDADVVGFSVGVPYEHVLGHRGLSHSLAFAACLAGVLTWATVQMGQRNPRRAPQPLPVPCHRVARRLRRDDERRPGVAFFAPFSGERYFFPGDPSRFHRFRWDDSFRVEASPFSLTSFWSSGSRRCCSVQRGLC